MDKNETYDNFLKSLRIALANTSIYSNDHPLFLKSVDMLRKSIEELFTVMTPLRMGIVPDFLVFGKESLKGARLYEEIANFFHQRKVKVVDFKEGIHNEELVQFLVNANLTPKDILLKGGLDNIVKKLNLGYVGVEDLDYSQFLKDKGTEDSDIWLFLLRKSLDKDGLDKLDSLANDFRKVLKKLRIEDLVENEDVRKNIKELLDYFKIKDPDKFSECSKELTRTILKDGGQLNADQVDKFKELMQGIEVKDMSDVLLEDFQEGDDVDPLTVNLFSKLIDRDRRKEVTISLIGELKKEDRLRKEPNVITGIKELLASSELSKDESKIYHDNLMAILENITLGYGLCFDRKQISNDYSFILLDLFVMELSPKRLEVVLSIILIELSKAIKTNDAAYIANFKKALDKKKAETFEFEFIFEGADRNISDFVERIIFEENCLGDIEFLIDGLKESNLSMNFYFDKIFKEGKVNQYILKLFFKFFPEQLLPFCANLGKRISDIRFIENIMKNLDRVEPALNLEIFKYIFSLANNFIRVQVLNKMGKLNLIDQTFLFSIFDKGNFLQRKQALLLLNKSSSLRDKIAKMLLDIRNPFGFKGKIIEDNLNLISEVFFPEAKVYLIALSKYRFFWNKNIRIKSKEILTKNGV
ncbi:MAG: hypothetical protein KAS05_00845 [Candidatus Omnitrophica bacterium]|nr:hypothetical protein [Candidatus Omnitrophota bacterium]